MTWRDLNGYFARLERGGTAINLGTFVTVGSVRRYVMGDANRAATPAELGADEAAGCSSDATGRDGLSSGLIYAPASYAPTAEVVELARSPPAYGGGYATHIRWEGARLVQAVKKRSRSASAAMPGCRSIT